MKRELLKNKVVAVLLILLTLPLVVIENDATATVFMGLFFSVPMFFSKKPWIL